MSENKDQGISSEKKKRKGEKEMWQPNEVINTRLYVDFKNKAEKNFNKIISEICMWGY